MNKDRIVVLVIFIAMIAAIAGFSLFGGDEATSVSPSSSTSQADDVEASTRASDKKFRGITLQIRTNNPDHPFEKYIDEIADTGANSICLVIAAWQEDCSSSSIFLEMRKTPTDEKLTSLIQHATSRGLDTILMPILLLHNPKSGEWRGKINPQNWDKWWQSYSDYILHYAKLAENAGVAVFMVGSELNSTEKQPQRWRKLIAETRETYAGLLAYSANWDHYHVAKWWDALDIAGMTSYHKLTNGEKPTLDKLLAAWKPIKTDILNWRESIKKPLLFTEVGWPNLSTCAEKPWDYTLTEKDTDPVAQANCFEAFFRTWNDVENIAGFLVWEWRSFPQQKIGPEDPSYVPCGKPALDVIKRNL